MTRLSLSLSDLCCCERLALWSIRCLISHYRLPNCPETKTTDGLFPVCFRPALDAAEGAFSDAVHLLNVAGQPGLAVNAPGMQSLTLLADCLAGAGHWLPKTLLKDETTISGGGALSSISRWRSVSLSRMRVLWPQDSGPLQRERAPEANRVMH